MQKIKVVLIEDSVVALQILKDMIQKSGEIEVVGVAHDGIEGLDIIAKTNPDVICSDLQMPRMDGLEFTKAVMTHFPKPVLIISNAVHPTDVDNIYNLMQAGAVDFFPKPTSGSPSDYAKLAQSLTQKIKVLAFNSTRSR